MDLIVDAQGTLIPLEIKQTETSNPKIAKEILSFQQIFKNKAGKGYVIYSGNMVLPLEKEVIAFPLNNL